MTQPITRRTLLGASLAGLPFTRTVLAQSPSAVSQTSPPIVHGLIEREQDPRNLETPAAALRDLITPTDLFFLRNHFAEPTLEPATWRLKVEGAVDRPAELTLNNLLTMPSRSQRSMLECAGNGRFFLVPKAKGVQWQIGAAGNVEWTGVPLAAVLQRVGLKSGAVDVMFEGADHGEIKDEPKSPGDIHFAHSIPVSTARTGDVLLAYKMNGADLSKGHGYPVRVVVPGWYGMASVKWLHRLVITDHPFDGFFQSLQYSHFERPDGTPTLRPVTEMHVKSVIVDPEIDGKIPAHQAYTVRGLAWTGRGTVVKVEVSTDNGKSWGDAKLTSPAAQGTWRSWEFEWRNPSGATQALMARATDSHGQRQPLERDRDRRSYEITHVVPIPVIVR